MFNFKKYQEIKKCHKQYQDLRNIMYKAEARYNRFVNKENQDKMENALKNTQTYVLEVYSKTVYSIFTMIKPSIYNLRTKQFISWQDLFEKDFNELSNGEKKGLVSLVEDNGGIYRLPPEFYIKK